MKKTNVNTNINTVLQSSLSNISSIKINDDQSGSEKMIYIVEPKLDEINMGKDSQLSDLDISQLSLSEIYTQHHCKPIKLTPQQYEETIIGNYNVNHTPIVNNILKEFFTKSSKQ
eukprot:463658_1